jgi:hypothetical protein
MGKLVSLIGFTFIVAKKVKRFKPLSSFNMTSYAVIKEQEADDLMCFNFRVKLLLRGENNGIGSKLENAQLLQGAHISI